MSTNPLLAPARALWEGIAGTPVAFPPSGRVRVVVSPESGICPAGWVGAVALGGSAIVTAPDEGAAAVVRDALAGVAAEAVVDEAALRAVLPVTRVLGPAALSYASPEGFRPVRPGAAGAPAVPRLPGGHPELRALERVAGERDAADAALDEITSPAFVVRAHGRTVAAAGYRLWPGRAAHLSVLTAPRERGRGLARLTASAATAHALAAGLLPQWRARVPASRRVAAALGYRELGAQLSVTIAP
ncbi:GNAT family N-acetyltransferase [Streptomyces sp. NPDC020141]|uniref:GNAT family N-acetyltransferase n=1 Tax=Streptomyces sp. NPDC020141 TaxID=3365065 RepID=UPI0037922788